MGVVETLVACLLAWMLACLCFVCDGTVACLRHPDYASLLASKICLGLGFLARLFLSLTDGPSNLDPAIQACRGRLRGVIIWGYCFDI